MTSSERKEPASPSMRLDGMTALVTGAGRGIGAGCAVAMAEAGAELILMSRTLAELEAVAAEIAERGGRAARCLVCDVTNDAERARAFAAIDRLDVLLNNAGINQPQTFVEVEAAVLDRILDVNVRAAFLVAQAATHKMLEDPDRKAKGGAIIHVSSALGHVGMPTRTVYGLTKHAIEGLNKAMAWELAAHGIRVNAVAPTVVETEMTRPFLADENYRNSLLSRVALSRVGAVSDVAGAVVFLASPAAAYITGASLLIDGGMTAR